MNTTTRSATVKMDSSGIRLHPLARNLQSQTVQEMKTVTKWLPVVKMCWEYSSVRQCVPSSRVQQTQSVYRRITEEAASAYQDTLEIQMTETDVAQNYKTNASLARNALNQTHVCNTMER